MVQKRPTSSSRSDPGPCRSRRVVPESSPAAKGCVSVCLSIGPVRDHHHHRGASDLCSREVLPAAVPQVGRSDVWALFPEQPLCPSTLVTRFLDGDGDLAYNKHEKAGLFFPPQCLKTPAWIFYDLKSWAPCVSVSGSLRTATDGSE